MNDSIIINKMIRVGESLATGVIERSGAEADARALLNEIKQALNIADVVKSYCKCSEPKPNYPELLWCKDCGDWIPE